MLGMVKTLGEVFSSLKLLLPGRIGVAMAYWKGDLEISPDECGDAESS